MNERYQGIYAALVTPYDTRGAVDYDQLQRLVCYLIDRGIDGFYVNGSTAETFLLTTQEREKCLEAVLEANGGRRKVVCHVGAISTDAAIGYTRHAERAGANAVSAISPFYYKFSTREIVGYYSDIMAATALPMFVYNFPDFSGFSLSEEVIDQLSKSKNLRGVKFTSSDMFLLQQLKANHPALTVWNGFDEMLAAGLTMGADGGVGSTYNCMAPLIRRIYDAFRAGELAQAQRWQAEANRVIKVICQYGVFSSVKTLLEFEGFAFHGCRRPFSPMPEEGRQALRQVYEHVLFPLLREYRTA